MILVILSSCLHAQSGKNSIHYYSADSLLITANIYLTSDTLPYIILFHDQGSSRGEFIQIIDRFQKMNFNCLVPDIRNGGNSNFVANETSKLARIKGYNKNVSAIEGDISASINYANLQSQKPVILLGAGANASLVLKAAKENEKVKAAIALSPGEFFQPTFTIEDTIAGTNKSLLITSSRMEYLYVEKIVSKVPEEFKTVFAPEAHKGARGTKALLPGNESNGEYWLALLLFFKDLQ